MTNESTTGAIPPLKLEFLADPGHGWLEVDMAHVRRLGIDQDITPYSYISRDGLTAYLEEDCDAPRFIEACRKAGTALELREHHCNGESFIRRLPSYPAPSRRVLARASRRIGASEGE